MPSTGSWAKSIARWRGAGLRWTGPTFLANAKEHSMRALHLSCAIAAAVAIVASAPVAASNCYVIVDRANEVAYQGPVPPVDLSDDGVAARNAMRSQGQQLIAMDTESCPVIDRGRVGGKSGPASVEEIVAGMRSATPYGTGAQPAPVTATSGGITLPRITVPRATGGGMSVGGPPSGMSIR
jgi:hypothetical protein